MLLTPPVTQSQVELLNTVIDAVKTAVASPGHPVQFADGTLTFAASESNLTVLSARLLTLRADDFIKPASKTKFRDARGNVDLGAIFDEEARQSGLATQ